MASRGRLTLLRLLPVLLVTIAVPYPGVAVAPHRRCVLTVWCHRIVGVQRDLVRAAGAGVVRQPETRGHRGVQIQLKGAGFVAQATRLLPPRR